MDEVFVSMIGSDRNSFPEDVVRENRVFSPEGSRSGTDLQKLVERLSSLKWEVIEDEPITIKCGNLLLKIEANPRSSSRPITRLWEKLDLLEYLMSVQPYKYLELCGTCAVSPEAGNTQKEGE